MMTKLFKIGSGFSGKRIDFKVTLLILGILYLLSLAYIGLFYEVTWIGNSIPSIIKFGGYRNIPITMFASILSFQFVVMYFVEIYWLNLKSNIFFNKITVRMLAANDISGRKIYFSFFLKRCTELFTINLLFILSIFLLFLLRDGVLLQNLILYSYILFYSSILLVLIYDSLFYLTKKSSSANSLTILSLIICPLISVVFRPLIVHYSTNSSGIKLLDLLPDVFSIGYQYVLYSINTSYSLSKIYYPIVALCILLATMSFLSKKLLVRFS